MLRRLAVAAAAVSVATALPAGAAPRSQLLHLGNVGEPSGNACTQSLHLLRQPTPGAECAGNVAGAANTGLIDDESYATAKGTALRVDAGRPVTGTFYAVHVPLVSGPAADALPNSPGYAKAVVTVKLDAVKVGQFTVEGVLTPVTPLRKDFSFPVPAGLRGATVKKVTVAVDWIDATGLVTTSYTAPEASTISIPVR